VLAQLEALGADSAAIRLALRSRECNSLTACYHLALEGHQEAQRAAAAAARAAERAAAAAATAARRPATAAAAAGSSLSDWQWDFAAYSGAATSAGATANGSSAGSVAASSQSSDQSSSLRGSGSPARPRTAAAAQPSAAGSPTRFGQEAAAAGYMASPGRHVGGSAGVSHGWSPFSPHHQQRDAAAAVAEQQGQRAATDRDTAFLIKALHPGIEAAAAAAAAVDGGGGSSAAATSSLVAAVAAELAAGAVISSRTAIVTAEGPSPSGKSPCLSPLPTVLSPKQLLLGCSSGGEHSPTLPQAA
jgi:hypothetical protein